MNGILKDKRVLFALSLVVSVIFWLTVSLVLRPTGEVVISGVGVNVNVQSGILGELGLSVIEGAEKTVNVTVSGTRSVIGGVSAEDIFISPTLTGVSGAGSYELELRATNNSSKDFDIVGIYPSTITVKFDKFVDKIVRVDYIIDGEYNIPDEFIQEDIYTDPKEITVTGPEIDLANISKAIVAVALSGEYNETIAAVGEITLVDEKGSPISYNEREITLSQNTATVYIPLHKTTTLPVTFDYTNIPDGFDISNIKYTLSADEIVVEGEDITLDKYTDIFIGYVDVRGISLATPGVSLPINLPEGLTMQERINKIDIDFNLEGYTEATFAATQVNIINAPKGYKITSNAKRVDVTLIGPEEVINAISAKDIVVQVDMSTREINQTGQYKMAAEVLLPGGENAWAIGVYSVNVTVKES